jgi:hypothetical protein
VEKNVGTPSAESSCDLWVEDEATVNLETKLKRVFAPRGATPVVRTRIGDYHQRVVVFISISRLGVVVNLGRGLGADMAKKHLEAVCEANSSSGFVLLWNRSGCHRTGGVVSFCVDLGVWMLYFPAYSPELNPVEEVIKQLKRYLANRLFWSEEEVAQAVLEFFERRNYRVELNIANYIASPSMKTKYKEALC